MYTIFKNDEERYKYMMEGEQLTLMAIRCVQ